MTISILGGGLAGGLIAYALHVRRPEVPVVLYERGETLGGNHVWSFFDGDIAAADRWLVEPFVSHSWPAYDVRFPKHSRTIAARYNSIESEQFDRELRAQLPTEAVRLNATVDDTPDGTVIDARGPGDLAAFDAGWQKFVGLLLRTERPHGVERPIVMDATVDQLDGYRFVYVLPFGPSELFIEDTYYSDEAELDVEAVRARVLAYAVARGWEATPANRMEAGVLPVIVSGDHAAYWRSTGADAAKAGMRAGLFHPTTGYSLPDAVRLASAIIAEPDLSGPSLARLTRVHASRAWKGRAFYRMLDTMLFRAAHPHERYRIMERFYTLPEPLIARFYAGQSTAIDKLRVLTGKPPIPIPRALGAILRTKWR